MTTPTPAERRAVAEIVLPGDTTYRFRYLADGSLNRHEERVVLEDGLLRARIASHFGTCSSGFYARCGEDHALDTIFTGDTMLDALWACALAHVREVERRKAEAEQPPPEPRRFFPGERVTVCGTSGSVLLVRGVEVVVLIDRNGVSFALTHENPNLAPETAARVIPYGPEGGTR